jgi:hypothetical protein
VDERGECVMSRRLGLAVQIEPGLDRMEATLQPFGIGPVDPRKMVQGRRPARLRRTPFLDGYRWR